MSVSALLEEVKLDLLEYEQLLETSQRPRVRESLAKEMDRLNREATNLQKKLSIQSQSTGASERSIHQQGYLENITNYAWDQSDKFMKLYLSLDNMSSLTDENIKARYTDKSVTVKVQFPNKTCHLHIARLCEEIVPNSCYCKKKSDYVLVMLKKSEVDKTWPWVTEREKKSKEKDVPKPKVDETEDPSAGITNLLKKMYDDGDDDMKRTISKAFYESQTKQGGGDMQMPMPDF